MRAFALKEKEGIGGQETKSGVRKMDRDMVPNDLACVPFIA